MDKKRVSLILGVVCCILVFMIFTQIKTITSTTKTVSQTLNEGTLRDEILKIKEKYDNLYKDTQIVETSLENERKKAIENNDTSIKMEEELKNVNKLLGLTELEGKGVIVILDDNKSASIETIGTFDSIENYLVHDGDLLQTINELKNAGAEAISVNEQRIVSTTSIICDGNVVKINDEKVGAPYTIRAIGSPERLYGALTRPESYLKTLTRDGVDTEVKKSNFIKIPKYEGTFNTEYIKILE